jgi:K+-transporting ATPase ATPase B chain
MSAMVSTRTAFSLFDPALVRPAIGHAFVKLDPRIQWRNPVMFVVYVGSILTTVPRHAGTLRRGEAPAVFILGVAVWLWFTVLFANFAEALAEGRSKAQTASLRGMKKKVVAKVLKTPKHGSSWHPQEAEELKKGVVVLVEAGDTIPLDGEVIEGVASVDESAITGESAPVIREAGGDFASVTGGHPGALRLAGGARQRQSGRVVPRPMIAMVEGARRQKTPNEIALNILLVALTIVFLVVVVTLLPMSLFSVDVAKAGTPVSVTTLVALLVCLIPTTIGALLSAIGVAGMSRMMQANVIATSGRAVEAAGDVDVLLMDKTGTITLGNRQASAFFAAPGITEQQLADAAQLASLADETPEGRSITVLAKQKFNLRERDMASLGARFIAFAAQTRMSGVDLAATPRRRRDRSGRAPAMRSGAMSKRSAGRFRPRSCRPWRRWRAAAARRWSSATGHGRSAWSSSRTSSRAASRSVSPSCAAWASRR